MSHLGVLSLNVQVHFLNGKQVYLIHRILSGATNLGQSGLGSNGVQGVICVLQFTSITGTSSSDCLVSYPGHFLEEYYPFSKSAHATAPVYWATYTYVCECLCACMDG